jgi:transposase
MLWELSVVEQRYTAVTEVLGGMAVTEVAARYGVSRQSVHGWLASRTRQCAPAPPGPGLHRAAHELIQPR